MNNLKTFLETTSTARKVRLGTRVVLARTRLSPSDLLDIQENGTYGPVPAAERTCELEAGGQIVARGRIVRKGGELHFKVDETADLEAATEVDR